MQKLLFLGYDRQQTRLIGGIERLGWQVDETAEPVLDFSPYDLVVSFGYKHILKADVLGSATRAVLNLHISYLPWNRGAHSLFWAAYDGTPAGVTIHEIDTGVDTGPICFQRLVEIDPLRETFASGYARLIEEIEMLFEQNAAALLEGHYTSRAQQGAGSVKRVRDLPSGFAWSDPIAKTVQKLKHNADV
jgi:methionyl-tRNA formyltransferase